MHFTGEIVILLYVHKLSDDPVLYKYIQSVASVDSLSRGRTEKNTMNKKGV